MQFSSFTFCYKIKFDEIPIQGKIDVLRRTSEYPDIVVREKNIFGFKRLSNEDRMFLVSHSTEYDFRNLVIYTDFQILNQRQITEDMVGKFIEQSEVNCIPEGKENYPLVWSKPLWEQKIGKTWLNSFKQKEGLSL